MSRYTTIFKGISEPLAIIILLGVFIVLALSLAIYVQSDYSIRRDKQALVGIIERENTDTIIRLIGSRGNAYAFLFKRLDKGNRVYFFIYNGTSYTDCRKVIRDVVGGRLYEISRHRIDDVLALQGDTPYSFRYYAKAMGYPDTGDIQVCAIEITDRNAIATLLLSQELKPNLTGAQFTAIEANGRSWRLAGSIEFTVKYLGNPRRLDHLKLNGTGYQLKVGDVVRINVNTTKGKIDITPQSLPVGGLGGWIQGLNIFATEVWLNNALLARNVLVEIVPEVAIDIDSLISSLYIEIYPSPPGFTRITYGGQRLVDHWNNSDYIRIMEWKIDSSREMVLELNPTNLYARGIATAVYIGPMPEGSAVDRLSVFVVTYVNNVPYLVGVYNYKLR